MWETVISRTPGHPCSSEYRAAMATVVSRLARYPSEYRLEAFRLLMNRLPDSRRLWSKTCLATFIWWRLREKVVILYLIIR